MNSTGKTKASQSALANASEATRKLNPHLFTQICEDHVQRVIKNTTPRKRIRQDKPMNKLEQEAFEWMQRSKSHERVRAHAKTFRLANGVRYTPDITLYSTILCQEMAIEVKGGKFEDDAAVKIKLAPKEFPEIRWSIMWKDGGQWQFQEVLP